MQNKRALVTGASGGIGKAIALELGRQGCREVVVHYHTRQQGALDTVQQLEALGCQAEAVQCDFRDPVALSSMMRGLHTEWEQGCDILVNNAGVVSKVALEDDSDALTAWHECMAVNLHAPRLLSHLAVEQWKNKPEGSVILNVGSIHGEKSNEYMGAYAASKAALESLTRTMAIEYASYNVRVNCIAPGIVPVERTLKAVYDSNGDLTEMAEGWRSKIPLRQLGTVEHVAQACMPLISNEWVTGAVWQVDGGMMARANMPERARPLLEGGRA